VLPRARPEGDSDFRRLNSPLARLKKEDGVASSAELVSSRERRELVADRGDVLRAKQGYETEP